VATGFASGTRRTEEAHLEIRDREVGEDGSCLRDGRLLEFVDGQKAEAASTSRRFGRCAGGEAEGWLWVHAGRERYRRRVGFRA